MHLSFDSNLGPPISGRAIFAVEGDEMERTQFLQALREGGAKHPCRFFATGEEMIEALLDVLKGAQPPLLCCFDLKMPGMCGLDVLRWIRLQEALADVSVVVLSAPEDSPALNEVLRHGAQCCAKKFPHPTHLQEILAEAEKFSNAASSRSVFDVRCNLLPAAQSAAT